MVDIKLEILLVDDVVKIIKLSMTIFKRKKICHVFNVEQQTYK